MNGDLSLNLSKFKKAHECKYWGHSPKIAILRGNTA